MNHLDQGSPSMTDPVQGCRRQREGHPVSWVLSKISPLIHASNLLLNPLENSSSHPALITLAHDLIRGCVEKAQRAEEGTEEVSQQETGWGHRL